MRTRLSSVVLFGLFASSGFFVACSDDDNDGNNNMGGASSGGSDSGSGGQGEGGSAPVAQRQINLQFRAQVGEEEFACGEVYSGQGSTKVEITPQDFRFFVSEIKVLRADGSSETAKIMERSPWQGSGVALLDFEDGSGECKNGNAQFNREIQILVPEGEYTGVQFSTSVPEHLNHEDPTTLPAPLQAGGMSWSWLSGFKFIRAEMLAVSIPAIGSEAGAGIFHLGSTGCDNSHHGGGGAGGAGPDPMGAPSVSCKNANRNLISLETFDFEKDEVVADIGAIMTAVDLSAPARCHSMMMQPACSSYFKSVGLDLMSSEQQDGQTAFRVQAK